MEIRELDRDKLTKSEMSAVTRLANIVDPERLPGDEPMSEQLVHDRLSPGGRFYGFRTWAMFDGGDVVALAHAEGSRESENSELCELTIAVDPDLRRRGLGIELYEYVKVAVEREGRTRTWGWGPLDDENRGFWEDGLGRTLGYVERISRCVLAEVDASLMETWIGGAADRAAGYHLERWQGRCPDHLAERLALARQAMNDAPTDDLEFADETFDVERVRDSEANLARKDLTRYAIMAIATATDELAGYTDVVVPGARPQISYQGDTVTIPAHRDRGIGRWVKAEMWKWLRTERPEITTLDTGNAESNDAMLSINLAMGFSGYLNLGVWHDVPD